MSDLRRLQLVPHPSQKATAPSAGLWVFVRAEGSRIEAKFEFQNSYRSPLVIPNLKASVAGRHDELWKTTCFELFLQPQGQKNYWEINVSPRGDWNAYGFNDYREGMRREEGIQLAGLPHLEANDSGCECKFTLDLGSLGVRNSEWSLGVTAVIEMADGNKSYWAIQHSTEKPDFHKSESFVHRLIVGNGK